MSRNKATVCRSLLLLFILVCGSTSARAQGGTGKLPPPRLPPAPKPAGRVYKIEPRINRMPTNARRPVVGCTASSPNTRGEMRIVNLPNGVELVMIEIPAGSFCMGSPQGDEQPVHNVTFDQSFFIGMKEVTTDQWRAVMGSNPGSTTDGAAIVRWAEAQEFVRRLSAHDIEYTYRLPSEAEWEYAARESSPTAHRQLNVFGLRGMRGPVGEWVEDVYHDSYFGAPVNGSVWSSGGSASLRVSRGCVFKSNATECRITERDKLNVIDGLSGLRIVAVRR